MGVLSASGPIRKAGHVLGCVCACVCVLYASGPIRKAGGEGGCCPLQVRYEKWGGGGGGGGAGGGRGCRALQTGLNNINQTPPN